MRLSWQNMLNNEVEFGEVSFALKSQNGFIKAKK